VDDAEWQGLCTRLRVAAATWREAVENYGGWDELSAAGALASAAHWVYLLGAIRQILAAMRSNEASQ
jgi:hypothetical protein